MMGGWNQIFVSEKFQKIKSDTAYSCFYLAVLIEVLIVLIDKSAYANPVEGLLFRLTFLLCFMKVCLTKYSLREYLVIVLFLGLGVISYIAADRNDVIRMVMFVAACKNVDMKKCLKFVFYLTMIGCIAIITLSLLGVGGEIALTQDYGRGSVETRYTLGMGHPNSLHCMIMALSVLGMYLYQEKLKWYSYLAVVAMNLFFFLLTDSKTSVLMVFFAVGYLGVCQYGKGEKIKKFCGIMSFLLTAGSIAVSVFCAHYAYYIYNHRWGIDRGPVPSFFVKLDLIFTGRVHNLVGTDRWEGTTSTWSLFSSPANHYYFDMGWVRLFYWYGIIPACIFVAVLFIVLFYCYKQKKYAAMMLLTSFAVYNVVEAHYISVYWARNYVLFLIGAYWCDILCEAAKKRKKDL